MRYDNAEFEAAYGTFSQLPESDAMEIAFSGRSNVGKSSLINKLLNRKSLARVSTKPGKTITINYYKLDEFKIVDLPGYGYAKVARSEKLRWAEMMEGYFNSHRNLRLVVQLIDIRHPATNDDLDMIEYLLHNEIPFIIVLTKSDKLKVNAKKKRLEEIEVELAEISEIPKIPFSAENGEGVEELKKYIEKSLK